MTTTNKLLFLDIDGVLNDHEYSSEAESCLIKPECVKAFNRVIRDTGAEVVLSSAWRYMILNKAMTLSGFHYMLRTHGVTKDLKIIGTLPYDKTQKDDGFARGRAILEWLRDNTDYCYFDRFEKYDDQDRRQVVKWAAIDDLDLGIAADLATESVVMTDGRVGMTEKDADQLIRILNSRK